MEVIRAKKAPIQCSLHNPDNHHVIRQTHNLSKLLLSHSQDLLKEYLKCQGDPFNQSDFRPSPSSRPDLPRPLPEMWHSLTDASASWTTSPLTSWFSITCEGSTGGAERAEPNWWIRSFLPLLETSLNRTCHLLANIRAVMDNMGVAPPEIDAPLPGNVTIFEQKVKG
ncbi:cardiotrophin-1-like isoform X2 [Huso huso]|uniref:Cardiotrophin-1-like isoform X2 n=1 Tax=Huso huso TaxID=61971 RepID=A0ABR0Y565_HUSHU